jgi:hydroxymethylpyrimidine pyrophosphatase-like HAD family hydrolase
MPVLVSDEKEKDIFYHEEFPEFNFYRTSPEIIDIVLKGTDKGTGIKKVVDLLGAHDIPSFGFGDGVNDFALFQSVDYRIAMGNAVQELKDMADYVTSENTNGGLVQALKHFELI